MKSIQNRLLFFSLSAALLAAAPRVKAEVVYVEPTKPYKNSTFLQSANPGKVDLSRGSVQIPMITWAADGVTVSSNEGTKANPDSPLAKAMGVSAELELVDNFDTQVKNYISGKSPFLRGTVGMINLASEALSSLGPDYAPVVIFQLSWSTGADGFVAKDIENLADLKGKSVVVQASGPHFDLVQVLLEDAGLKPDDVTIKYVSEITYNPDVAADGNTHDPAGAFREDSSIAGAACIFPDILTLTAGGTVGTGAEDSVKGARPILTTRTASRVIADVYAVRADFFRENREIVHGFVQAQLSEQESFQAELANIAKKSNADKSKVDAFKKKCGPLAEIFLLDAGAVNDYIAWVGVDLELAGKGGNIDFFTNDKNPIGFVPSCERIQKYYAATGTVENVTLPEYAGWNFSTDFGGAATPITKKKEVFTSTQMVRKAAESEDASMLFSTSFQFPANTSNIEWQNHKDIFDTLHEKVTRYGGAIVQLRGHADNFFYNFVLAKKQQGENTYKKRVAGTNQFKEYPLPKIEQVVNSANQLSYERAFAVKRAYAQYLREAQGFTNDEIDLSRFDVKGMGISDPIHGKPTKPEQRAENMRGEMFIYAVEAEIPLDFGVDDLQ
ncbi:MAG: hypothetical protein CMO55_15435 [Verrucomicrobiales bacterium]|nr:hypothetical protein [Verrucomicrobiales bacterium]